MPSGPQLERYLRAKVEGLGGRVYKFTSPGQRGVPDRLVILPRYERKGRWGTTTVTYAARIFFVEAKGDGDRLMPSQERQIKRMRAAGAVVYIADAYAQIDYFIDREGRV